jgi:hypothetical protein
MSRETPPPQSPGGIANVDTKGSGLYIVDTEGHWSGAAALGGWALSAAAEKNQNIVRVVIISARRGFEGTNWPLGWWIPSCFDPA